MFTKQMFAQLSTGFHEGDQELTKNELCSPNFFSGSTNKTRTMFAKQRFAQLRTGITTVISLDRCTEIRSASSLEQPVRAEFGGRVPEREAEWRKGAGNEAEWRNGAGKGAEWRKGAGNGGTVAGECRKAKLGMYRTQREDAGRRGLVGAGHKH